jgi:tetratricopeptide (TPR) repeat protein
MESTEQAVGRLRMLQRQGQHAAVVRDVHDLLSDRPDDRDLLLIEATSLRYLGRVDEALETLDRLERLYPAFGRQQEERGLCRVAQKDAPGAIGALLRAVDLNPALTKSWSMLEGLYRLIGDQENAALAASSVAKLKTLPAEVVTATSLFSEGDLGRAETMIRGFLIQRGDHPEAMRLLAKIGIAQDALDDAEFLLEAVLDIVPDHRAARYEYAETLNLRHKYAQARDQIDRLLALEPANPNYRAVAATAAMGLGQQDVAIELYRTLLADQPGWPDANLWLGHALKTVGHLPEAIESYRAAAAARPSFGDAWWSLANLKRYRFTDDELTRMRAAAASPATGPEDRSHLYFALGKALEDRGEAAESWAFYEQGNALKRIETRYRPEILETNTHEQIRVCTRDFFAKRQGWGDPSRDPIFILGLPRAGSTLLEQILASHSQVEGTQELAQIQAMVLEIQGRDHDFDNPRYPAALADMTPDDFRHLGERYLAETRIYRTDKPYFIDKMPNNFRHIGMIHLMLPNARIIDARRDPMSCCFSNLKQLFARGQGFTYSIEDIARYYRTYLDLMAHWDAVLPGRVLRVQHEDVVDDLEGSVRRILDYCGLDFEPACVAFHDTKRSVRTPSSEQVRQPIFRDGLDGWRPYEPWLGPLRDALGDALVRYRSTGHGLPACP